MSILFNKGDFRRTLVTIAIIEENQPITLNKIVALSNMPKGTVQEQLKKIASEQLPEITLNKEGAEYTITSSNKIIDTKQVRIWYKKLLKKTPVKDC